MPSSHDWLTTVICCALHPRHLKKFFNGLVTAARVEVLYSDGDYSTDVGGLVIPPTTLIYRVVPAIG